MGSAEVTRLTERASHPLVMKAWFMNCLLWVPLLSQPDDTADMFLCCSHPNVTQEESPEFKLFPNLGLTYIFPYTSPPNRPDCCLSLFCAHLGKKQQHKGPFMMLRQNRGVYKGRLYALVPFSCQLYNTSCRWVVTAFRDVHRQVEKIAEVIWSLDVERWGSCHCTGDTVRLEVHVNVT